MGGFWLGSACDFGSACDAGLVMTLRRMGAMHGKERRARLRGAVARGDGASLVALLREERWPDHALHLIGDGLFAALAGRVDGAEELARLDQPLTVRDLADRAGLSTRQLARRMHAELQVGPLDWLHQQRIARAQELLERTDAAVEQIATSCGMGTATTLRRHFHRAVGVSPTAYRATFRLR
jgi:AraC-like DNA-binding protein